MNLRAYEGLKTELADVLRSVPWRASDTLRNRELFARLAEDRFNVVVVGGFSRGKSTLMNAMLGMDRLPTGIEPLTSVVTSVCYGSEERVTLYFRHTALFLDVGLGDLSKYITERGNPGNQRGIREAEIQLPAELLRRGFRFVDTPGLGSKIHENTQTTMDFLQEADALVLVSGFDDLFTAEEARLADFAQQHRRRLFVVLNKVDELPTNERDRLIAIAQKRFSPWSIEPGQALFVVSARDGLKGQIREDPALLEASGLRSFQAALVSYILADRRPDFLIGMADRIGRIVAQDGGLPDAQDVLQDIRLRAALMANEANHDAPSRLTGASAPYRSCEVCQEVEEAVFEKLATLQAELRRSKNARLDLLRHGGLCGPHTRQMARLAAPREMCTGLGPILQERAKLLTQMARSGLQRDQLSALLPSRETCPLCEQGHTVESRCREAILTNLEAGRRRPGTLSLCLPHGISMAHSARNDDLASEVLLRVSGICERASDDMRGFAIKQDASRRDAMTLEERNAGARGLSTLIGDENADLVEHRVKLGRIGDDRRTADR